MLRAGCPFSATLKTWGKILEAPATSIHFLQLAPGEFLFVSIKVAGYAGLILALPYIVFQVLSFILPGLTEREKRLIAPAVSGSAILFIIGIFFAWWTLVPDALGFIVNYGSAVVAPLLSIEKYLDFVFLSMLSIGLSFQIPILTLTTGFLVLIMWKQLL